MNLDLNDPDLVRRLTIGLRGDPEQEPPRIRGGIVSKPIRTRTRRPSISSVIRQMKRAGVEIAGCKVNPRDGTVIVLTGKPDETTTPNSDETTDDHSWDDIDAQAKTKPPVH